MAEGMQRLAQEPKQAQARHLKVQGRMPLVGRKPEKAAERARFFGYNARSEYPKNNLAAAGCLVEGPSDKGRGGLGAQPNGVKLSSEMAEN